MARCFNTAHANRPQQDYTLPPLERLPSDIVGLVEDGYYFVLHAPRQSGKTTSMMALADKLRESGKYAVVFASLEAGRGCKNVAEVVDSVVNDLRIAASNELPAQERPPVEQSAEAAHARTRLYTYLQAWAKHCARPLVLILDEIDCLENEGLISVLSQLRKGYAERPKAFPHSVAIFGMRDVRDYKVASGGSGHLGSASPFNIKRESLTIHYFDRNDIAELFGQHTAETSQIFSEAAIDRVWHLTQGQPHLVNALADSVVRKQKWPDQIEVPQIDEAKERFILERGTHLDSLMDRLREDRVRRVIQPILAGADTTTANVDDEGYVRDLGLISGRHADIANPIYREVIARYLSAQYQGGIRIVRGRWLGDDGRLDIDGLRSAFVAFWREYAEPFVAHESYQEVAVQLVLMGFLQRVVNGGGHILREYAAGMGRIDVLIRWPLADAAGKVDLYGTQFENHLWELKVWTDRNKRADPKAEGLEQIAEYLARVPCESASLVIFDRREVALRKSWEKRLKVEVKRPVVAEVAVWVVRA